MITNEDICNFISHRMKVHDNLETISNEVIDTCLYKVSLHLLPQENNIFCLPQGSRDNMSIIIIAFPACPTVDPAAVKLENELNALLEKKVTGLTLRKFGEMF